MQILKRVERKGYDNLVKEFPDIEDIGQLLKSEKRYFHVSVEAYDIYTVAHLAILTISEKLNIASFYNLLGHGIYHLLLLFQSIGKVNTIVH